jgi:hypothetical protein
VPRVSSMPELPGGSIRGIKSIAHSRLPGPNFVLPLSYIGDAPALGYRLACDDDVTAEASQCVQESEKVLINSICTLLLEPMTCAGKNLHITQAGHQRW